MTLADLAVFHPSDLTEPVAYLPEYRDLQVMEEHNGPGGFSVLVAQADEVLVEHPGLLNSGMLVRVRVPGREMWFEIQRPSAASIVEGEDGARYHEIAGPGIRSWLGHAVVYPESGVSGAPEARYFGFASKVGPWFDEDEWVSPVNQGPGGGSNQYGSGWPSEWPTATAQWVWDRDTASTPAPDGEVYFRRQFSTSSTQNLRIYASAETTAVILLDNEPVMTVSEFGAWQRTFYVDLEVAPGQHVLAVAVRKRGTGTAGLLLSVVNADTNALVLRTGDSGWLMNAYPAVPPGWTPGLVAGTLLEEAEARNVDSLNRLDRSFTADEDSYGQPWPDAGDWGWSIGTSYDDVWKTLEGSMVDTWVDGLTLAMAPLRGVDRTLEEDPVIFHRGLNVKRAEATAQQTEIVNTLLVRDSSGLSEESAVDPGGLHGRREGYLGASNSSSHMADLMAQQTLARMGRPLMHPTLEVTAEEGRTPWVDFGVGDWILAPSDDDPDLPVRRRVVSIGAKQNEATGDLDYEIEIDSIAETEDQLLARWLNRMESGVLSGTAAIGQSPSETPSPGTPAPTLPTGRTPAAPGTPATSASAYIGPDGASYAAVTIAWPAVTVDTLGDPISVDSYEVWGRQAILTNDRWRRLTAADTNETTIEGFAPGYTWSFRVRALSDEGRPSGFSTSTSQLMPEDNVAPPVPSDPTMSSRLSTLTVYWDGWSVSAAPMPPDFSHVEIALSDAPDAEDVVGRLNGKGSLMLFSWANGVRLALGETAYVRLRSVDRSGNVSDWSDEASITIVGVEGPDIEANTITAGLINTLGLISEGVMVTDEEGSIVVNLTGLGDADTRGVTLLDEEGLPSASMSADTGLVYGRTLAGDAIELAGEDLATRLDTMARGVVCTGIQSVGGRTANVSSTVNAEIELMELSFDAEAGRVYWLTMSPLLVYCPPNANVRLMCAYTNDGSTPRRTSPLLAARNFGGTRFRYTGSVSSFVTFGGTVEINPTLNEEYRFLFFLQASASENGTVSVFDSTQGGVLRVTVTDLGKRDILTNMAVNRTGVRSANTGENNDPPDPPKKKQYQRQIVATSFRTFLENGNEDTGSQGSANPIVGDSPYTSGGSRRAQILFPSLGIPSGATMRKLEVYLYAEHWHYNAGGQVSIRYSSNTGLRSTTTNAFLSGQPLMTTTSFGKPQGRWVTLPSSAWSDARDGNLRSLFLHAPSFSNSASYYGYFSHQGDGYRAPKIRVTYEA